MKKSIIPAIAAIFFLPLLFAFSPIDAGFHEAGIIVKVQPAQQNKSFVLRLANLQKRPARVVIMDHNEQVFLSEKILNHNGYRKLINLSEMRPGNYKLLLLHPTENKYGALKLGTKEVEIVWQDQGQ